MEPWARSFTYTSSLPDEAIIGGRGAANTAFSDAYGLPEIVSVNVE